LTINEIHKHNISCIRFKENNKFIKDYLPYLGIINSKLIGYFLFHVSPQWEKGEEKRYYLRNEDVEKLPIPVLNTKNDEVKHLSKLVKKVEETEDLQERIRVENQIDDLVFDLYNLLEYEKEIIHEFYEIKVERDGKRKFVTKPDLLEYIKNFSETFSLMLAENYILTATYNISSNLGAVVCFTIVDKYISSEAREDKALEILHFVKKQQMKQADTSKILNEDKVKIYDGRFFYIIKSNLFKDWTKRQAIKDAKEEVGLLLSNLPETHDP
jgi:hypothetical protein